MDFDHRLALLRARYVASLPSKRDHVADAWSNLRAAPADAGARNELRTLLHRLAGSAPAYGHAELGGIAADASQQLGDAAADAVDLIDEITQRIERVLHLLEAIPGGSEANAAVKPSAATPLRVILVEDDPEQAELIAAALGARGCTVRHAEHSESLWEVLTTWPCDAVVLDYWLGTSTARDLVGLVRNEPTFASIALVCLTVETDVNLLAGVIEGGCDAVLSKHHPPDAIVEALTMHVMRRRAMR
ncbi:MAG: response regulator [Xanthomonadales bacterium]|nr:response regulator [Xanthomonadales bacterium]